MPDRVAGGQQGHAGRSSQVRASRGLSKILRMPERRDAARAGMQRRHRLQRGAAEMRRARERSRMVRESSFAFYIMIITHLLCYRVITIDCLRLLH